MCMDTAFFVLGDGASGNLCARGPSRLLSWAFPWAFAQSRWAGETTRPRQEVGGHLVLVILGGVSAWWWWRTLEQRPHDFRQHLGGNRLSPLLRSLILARVSIACSHTYVRSEKSKHGTKETHRSHGVQGRSCAVSRGSAVRIPTGLAHIGIRVVVRCVLNEPHDEHKDLSAHVHVRVRQQRQQLVRVLIVTATKHRVTKCAVSRQNTPNERTVHSQREMKPQHERSTNLGHARASTRKLGRIGL